MTRESNFELLRILSMYFIILYHLILFFIEGENLDVIFWRAIKLPLHVGVILFVLISGYFGINTKVKGIVHLLILTFIYFTPLNLVDNLSCLYHQITNGDFNNNSFSDYASSIKATFCSFFFLSKSTYWFVRTYLWLYLFAPVVNYYINQSRLHLYYLLSITGLISLYMGLVGGLDPSLQGGNNIINFIFLYCLGRFLNYEQSWQKLSFSTIIPIYLLYNITVFTLFYFSGGGNWKYTL